ncbi:MAG: gamma-glutamylcyclotransferase family protein [Pirellulales bacterium]
MSLFTYGSLMYAEVWECIGLKRCVAQPAILSGFAIYRVCDSLFPGIIQAGPDDQVQGVLYHDLEVGTLVELDAYESELYERTTVYALNQDSVRIKCQDYVIPLANRAALSNDVWDSDWFQQHGLAKYLQG